MAADDRWKKLAHIIEAQDVGVDLETVTDDPEWAAQALQKNGQRAREFVTVFDALLAMGSQPDAAE
ncbi:MAG: hypothetical protein J0J04_08060 [Microbacterium sp.]|uniref:hypothetical protein n=1 Tax=Microbacterium sp. TaxID=51671 RepID=UPI001ACB87F5|nr:hypothetical protein [Microbacterium sp.]MBN9214754.1 hypothetical protein [Microbacterium sp.]